MYRSIQFYSALFLCTCASWSQAEVSFKCWTNEAGVMECGNTVPSEFVSQGYEVRNENADVVAKQAREMSPEERNRLLEAERQRIETEKQAKQQAEEDKRLLDLFPNERDITSARDLKVGRINKSIEITQKDLNSRKRRLEKLRVQAERAAKRTDKTSQENLKTFQSHIKSLEGQIETIEMSIASKEKEKQEIQTEANNTLAKYREIQQRLELRRKQLQATNAQKAKEKAAAQTQ